MKKHIAKCLFGFEELLKEEVILAGGKEAKPINRGVSFLGDNETMYRINYTSRIAISILQELTTFPAEDEHDFYKQIYKYEWENLIDKDGFLFVEATTNHDTMNHSHYLSQLTKDAVVDRFRDKTGGRPSVDSNNPDIRISIHLTRDTCTVSLNSSGQALFKRGYRAAGGEAPLNEVLAASLLKLTGWDGTTNLYDPMCGSGTFLTEGAFIALNIPPGYIRDSYGFQRWKGYDKALYESVKQEADSKIKTELDIDIIGGDISASALSLSRRNCRDAGVDQFVKVIRGDFFKNRAVQNFSGTIIANPPYGERIGGVDHEMIYSRIGSTLKHHYTNTSAWILTGSMEGLKFIGLKSSKKIKVFNGSIECYFVRFDLYEGSKKHQYLNDEESEEVASEE